MGGKGASDWGSCVWPRVWRGVLSEALAATGPEPPPVVEIRPAADCSLKRRRRTVSGLVGAGVLRKAPGICRMGVAVGWKDAMVANRWRDTFLLLLSKFDLSHLVSSGEGRRTLRGARTKKERKKKANVLAAVRVVIVAWKLELCLGGRAGSWSWSSYRYIFFSVVWVPS